MKWACLLVVLGFGVGCQSPAPTNSTDSGSSTTPPGLEDCRGGFQALPFDSSEGGLQFGDLAGDFTVTLLDGEDWTLSSAWTGCDSYVFINYIGSPTALWDSPLDDLLRVAPRNVHFFFVSDESTRPEREARVGSIRDRLTLSKDQAERVHFVRTRLSRIEGSVGAFVTDYQAYIPDSAVDLGDRGMAPAPPLYFFGIDRDQRWDSGGSVNNTVGGQPEINMASYLPRFYNHKAELAQRLANEEADEFVVLDASVTDRTFVVPVELPADLAAYDTLEFDVAVFCPHRNVFACSEWDRIARISLCTDGKACESRREIVRWITPYWRRGGRRWAIDASPFLGLLSGGTTHLFVEMGPSWERATERDVRIALRLATKGEARSQGAELAFTGGNFDATYNEKPPFSFTPPPSASKVELVTILSGHGQDGTTNCAEWCDHRHEFVVNETGLEPLRHDGRVGSARGCAPASSEGVSPGQFGNWAPERAFWCPGLPVDAVRTDITELVTLGESNELTYTANTGGVNPPGGGNISLSAYVVWYE